METAAEPGHRSRSRRDCFAGQARRTGAGGVVSLAVRIRRAGRYRLSAGRSGCVEAGRVVLVARGS